MIVFVDDCSLSFSELPLAMCKTCTTLGSALRSQSQVMMRSGRPNALRKYEATFESGNCIARQPAGYPANSVAAPVTCDMASSITSAIRRFG